MASSSIIIPTAKIFQDTTEKFVDNFTKIGVNPDLTDNMELNFEIDRISDKLKCYLTLARPGDAVDITEIYKDCYLGTYPYKEMENPIEVRKMIESKNYHWVLFKSPEGKTVGCFTYIVDTKRKRGYMRGLMIKRKYQSLTNFKKLAIGSAIGMWATFQDRIHLWFCENRTAHAKSQYISAICGCLPVAFFPNKDIFMEKVESDLFHIIYSETVLKSLRRKKPVLIEEVKNIYSLIAERYSLEEAEFVRPIVSFDCNSEDDTEYRIKIEDNGDNFGYHKVKIKILGTDSYLKFLYTPMVQNIEKTGYMIDVDAHLMVLLNQFKKYAFENNVRYLECFVSAYEPIHQRIFCDAGFKVRGYIPCWKRVERPSRETFEDSIVFNLEEGKISPDIQLIPEGQEIVLAVY